jgi:hypothetical protein
LHDVTGQRAWKNAFTIFSFAYINEHVPEQPTNRPACHQLEWGQNGFYFTGKRTGHVDARSNAASL